MNFNEAMIKLKEGKRVTRQTEKDNSYFVMQDNNLQYRSKNTLHYAYDKDIMISEDWYLLNDDEKKYKFTEIIPLLLQGFKFKLKGWEDSYIYYDTFAKSILLIRMVIRDYIPAFEDFVADDWIEII